MVEIGSAVATRTKPAEVASTVAYSVHRRRCVFEFAQHAWRQVDWQRMQEEAASRRRKPARRGQISFRAAEAIGRPQFQLPRIQPLRCSNPVTECDAAAVGDAELRIPLALQPRTRATCFRRQHRRRFS
jgi:hypothetical protein